MILCVATGTVGVQSVSIVPTAGEDILLEMVPFGSSGFVNKEERGWEGGGYEVRVRKGGEGRGRGRRK